VRTTEAGGNTEKIHYQDNFKKKLVVICLIRQLDSDNHHVEA